MTAIVERNRVTRREWLIIAVAAAALLVLLPAAFRLGTQHRSDSWTLTGTAYVGDNQATVKSDGWASGFTPIGMPWFDAAGEEHDDNIGAPCLRTPGRTVHLRYGASAAYLLNGARYRVVTWVQCLG